MDIYYKQKYLKYKKKYLELKGGVKQTSEEQEANKRLNILKIKTKELIRNIEQIDKKIKNEIKFYNSGIGQKLYGIDNNRDSEHYKYSDINFFCGDNYENENKNKYKRNRIGYIKNKKKILNELLKNVSLDEKINIYKNLNTELEEYIKDLKKECLPSE